jgi:hypothetical protein
MEKLKKLLKSLIYNSFAASARFLQEACVYLTQKSRGEILG